MAQTGSIHHSRYIISPDLARVKAIHRKHFAQQLFFAFIMGRHPRLGSMSTGAHRAAMDQLDVVQTVLAQGLSPMKGLMIHCALVAD